MFAAQRREALFAVMAEGGVTDVVAEGDRLDKILVEMEKTPHRTGDFGNELDMQHPVRDMIVLDQGEHLGLVDVTSVGAGMENAVGILGKGLPVSLLRFRQTPHCLHAQGGEGAEKGPLPRVEFKFQAQQSFETGIVHHSHAVQKEK